MYICKYIYMYVYKSQAGTLWQVDLKKKNSILRNAKKGSRILCIPETFVGTRAFAQIIRVHHLGAKIHIHIRSPWKRVQCVGFYTPVWQEKWFKKIRICKINSKATIIWPNIGIRDEMLFSSSFASWKNLFSSSSGLKLPFLISLWSLICLQNMFEMKICVNLYFFQYLAHLKAGYTPFVDASYHRVRAAFPLPVRFFLEIPKRVYHAFYMVHTVVEVGTVVFPLFTLGFIHHPWWLFGISEPSTVWYTEPCIFPFLKLPRCITLPPTNNADFDGRSHCTPNKIWSKPFNHCGRWSIICETKPISEVQELILIVPDLSPFVWAWIYGAHNMQMREKKFGSDCWLMLYNIR